MSAENKKAEKAKSNDEKLAIILIRGRINLSPDAKHTLNLLKLYRKNSCVLMDKNDSLLGMLRRVKDFVTYGEADGETLKALSNLSKDKKENLFRLAPPKGGFQKKGIKKSFNVGGALGYRGEKINDLIKRMLP